LIPGPERRQIGPDSMFRVFFEEFILPLFLFFVVRGMLGSMFASRRSKAAATPAPSQPPAQPSAELRKDPVCGTYVSISTSVSRKVNGQMVYFCSEACRSQYRAA
jgi:YHS domain-containing protein